MQQIMMNCEFEREGEHPCRSYILFLVNRKNANHQSQIEFQGLGGARFHLSILQTTRIVLPWIEFNLCKLLFILPRANDNPLIKVDAGKTIPQDPLYWTELI